jgi:hypothetical protein
MRAPDLADLIDREEHAVVQRTRAAKCLHEWQNVLAWLSTVDGLPIYERWMWAAFRRATNVRAQQERMQDMLYASYPRCDLADLGDKNDKAFYYNRLLSVVRCFVAEGIGA